MDLNKHIFIQKIQYLFKILEVLLFNWKISLRLDGFLSFGFSLQEVTLSSEHHVFSLHTQWNLDAD